MAPAESHADEQFWLDLERFEREESDAWGARKVAELEADVARAAADCDPDDVRAEIERLDREHEQARFEWKALEYDEAFGAASHDEVIDAKLRASCIVSERDFDQMVLDEAERRRARDRTYRSRAISRVPVWRRTRVRARARRERRARRTSRTSAASGAGDGSDDPEPPGEVAPGGVLAGAAR
jgi:hypothetical protein